MYVAIGVNFEGKKELLGLWLNETEGAKFWLSCLTDLKNLGVQDFFIVSVDGLSGFPEAIQAVAGFADSTAPLPLRPGDDAFVDVGF